MNIKYFYVTLIFALFALPVFSQTLEGDSWHFTFESNRYGPLEAVLRAESESGKTVFRGSSSAADVIAKLPKANGEPSKIEFELSEKGESLSGVLFDSKAKIVLEKKGKALKGKVEGGRYAGTVFAIPWTGGEGPLRDYDAIIRSFENVVKTKVFDPESLSDSEWKKLTNNLKAVAKVAQNDFDVLFAFHYSYDHKPFSHLTFGRAKSPAKDLIAFLDTMSVGGTPVSVSYDGDIAVLRVETMIGVNTIELIEKAFKEIAVRKSRSLIIDIRKNGGGAFAVKPLIEHVIDRPFDAGYFTTHNWNIANDVLPTAEQVEAIRPWEGFSLRAWWESVQTESIIKLRFSPAKPNFDGPVFVLVDKDSASATELAADAFKTSGVTVLIGETTAGEMLTQSPYDVEGGFQIFVPVGDYFSIKNGRIEGVGVKPDFKVNSADAMAFALTKARQ